MKTSYTVFWNSQGPPNFEVIAGVISHNGVDIAQGVLDTSEEWLNHHVGAHPPCLDAPCFNMEISWTQLCLKL